MSPLQKLIDLDQDARDFGFDWPDPVMILDQVIDECREIQEVIEKSSSRERVQEEIGDLLHAAISLCLFSGFSVEETLEKINEKFSRRMMLLKEITKNRGLKNLQGQDIEYKLSLWREAKKIE